MDDPSHAVNLPRKDSQNISTVARLDFFLLFELGPIQIADFVVPSVAPYQTNPLLN